MLGYSVEEIMQMRYADLFVPDDQVDTGEAVAFQQDSLDSAMFERRIQRKDGEIIWILLNEAMIQFEGNQSTLAHMLDITQHKAMQVELERSWTQYDELLTNIPAAVFRGRQDPDGSVSIEYVSDLVRIHTGLTAQALTADVQNLFDIVHPDDYQRIIDEQEQAMRDMTPYTWEGRILVDGEERWLNMSSRPKSLPNGGIVWNGIMMDVTERQRYREMLAEQEKLRVAFRKEQELSGLKSRMMERIAHEFRTPLAIIQTSATLLDRYRERLPEERRNNHFRRIGKQIQHISSMLDDIALAVRTPNRVDWIAEAPVDLRQLLHETISMYQEEYPHQHEFVLNIANDATIVKGDRALYETVIRHLVSNAVKYAPENGRVEITLRRYDDVALLLSIQDNGIGILKQEQQSIFEPFFRGSNVEEIGGLGIGLALVHVLLEQIGASVTVTSDAGQGSTFEVLLPNA
jgi:PAS domain S-box-containing protein